MTSLSIDYAKNQDKNALLIEGIGLVIGNLQEFYRLWFQMSSVFYFNLLYSRW